MDYFENLLEGCKFEIISKTTPADAVRSIIFIGFKFVGESDEIWRRFLPNDYQEIIDRSVFSLVCNTKKELFFHLCDSHILLDGGKLSFFLDKHSGKKSFMISSRELIMLDSHDALSWQWGAHCYFRFSEVAYLIIGNQLDIRGTLDTKMLSQKTEYNAYLVFKLVNMCDYRLESGIRLVNYESETDTINLANTVHLPRLQESGNISKMRGYGWMEVKLGYFDSKKGTGGPVEARLFEMSHIYKGRLIVEGVEFHPK